MKPGAKGALILGIGIILAIFSFMDVLKGDGEDRYIFEGHDDSSMVWLIIASLVVIAGAVILARSRKQP